MIPVGPMRHKVGVRNQNTRCILVGAKHANRLARLHQKSLVIFQFLQAGNDLVKILPGTCRPADTAINHKFMRVFGNVRMQVIHQHAHRCFGQPAFGSDFRAGCRIDVALVMPRIVAHDLPLNVGASSANFSRMEVRCVRSFAARLSS